MKEIDYAIVKRLNDDIDILKQIIKTSSALAKLNGTSKIIPNQNILISTLGIQESRNSSAIENIFTTNSEVFEHLIYDNQQGAAKEVLNYSKAVHKATKSIKERPITIGLLEEIQSVIEPHKSGVRKIQVHIGNVDTNQIIHMPPKPNELFNLLTELIEFINMGLQGQELDGLLNAIISHHRFESIHPFMDGNGRTGRILIIMQLLVNNYLDQPILYLSRYINKTRSVYYQHLNQLSNNPSYDIWKSYIIYYLVAMESVALESAALVIEINELMVNIKEQLVMINFKRNSDIRLIDLLFIHPYLTSDEYSNELNVSKRTAINDINKIVESGILEKVEKSSKTYYVNKGLLELLEAVSD